MHSAMLGLPGLSLALSPTEEWGNAADDEISDDIEGERETLYAYEAAPDCEHEQLEDEDEDIKGITKKMSVLEKTVFDASKGVTEGTDAEYRE
ncbi:hypothetical protein H0H92_008636 [Tricholoma furcatifolium]|nr:hypothetical protein H0H92_008636 [Tricholoma furcatifolium]